MTPDEIAVLKGNKCIFQLRGVRPFLSEKYDITKHKRYKLLSDYNEKNAFDINKYMSTKLKLKPGQVVDIYNFGRIEESGKNTGLTGIRSSI